MHRHIVVPPTRVFLQDRVNQEPRKIYTRRYQKGAALALRKPRCILS